MDAELLSALYAYNTYANRLVLDTAAQLSDEAFAQSASPSHDSVQILLLHMLRVELFFLKQSQGRPLLPPPTAPPTLAQIRDSWGQLSQEQEAFVSSLTAADLKREIAYQMAGRDFRLPMWQLLTQAVVHSIHHRGELSVVLSQLGHPLPTLDIIIPFVIQSGQEWP